MVCGLGGSFGQELKDWGDISIYCMVIETSGTRGKNPGRVCRLRREEGPGQNGE